MVSEIAFVTKKWGLKRTRKKYFDITFVSIARQVLKMTVYYQHYHHNTLNNYKNVTLLSMCRTAILCPWMKYQ
jgi:hypothetical protein